MAIVVLISLALSSGTACADGGFMGKEGRDIAEPEQIAAIFFHQGMEELFLSVSYRGAVDEFAWLVPRPEPPEIEGSDVVLFLALSAFSPSVTDRGVNRLSGWESEGENKGVEVIEERSVGALDLTVVRADDAEDLGSWL
ncbi:MAG: DUF2330 domain-containing protein [Actinobacteria bacterium]|nr:DUF2330 domain-containing protein [Actinomycetota bacterium]